jgi:hypothetical protein
MVDLVPEARKLLVI